MKLQLAGRAASVVVPQANCYAAAAAAFFYAGVSAARGEEEEQVYAYVARAVAFDPELAALWDATWVGGEEEARLFVLLLQARAWHGTCPGGETP